MSISKEQMHVADAHDGIPPRNENKETTQKHYAEQKKPHTKEDRVCDVI